MPNLVPLSSSSASIMPRARSRAGREISRLETQAIARTAEIQAVTYVARQALRAVTDLSVIEEELAKVAPMSARLRLAAIGDISAAVIQARVLDMIDGI